MSDFHQRGLMSTLPRLNAVPLQEMERKLEKLAESQGTALILPCTLDDFRRPAMRSILREIRQAHYLSEVVVSINQATAEDLGEIRAQLDGDPRITLIWNDHPELQKLLPEPRAGKGFNLWTALGWLYLRGGCKCVIAHDCDILHYSRELPALLTWPLLDPELGYRYVKGYYPRYGNEGGQLFGRVTRLFVGPLLRALVRVEGHTPLLDFLECFRYPLAGEFGGRLSDLAQFPLSDGWGLEMDLLCSVHRVLPPEAVAQIDLGANYEHKHQMLENGRRDSGLTRLSAEISACLLHHLAREGMRLTPHFLQALSSAYQHSARNTLRRYRHVALLNRLHFPEEEETRLVEQFSAVLDRPLENHPASLPAWSELLRTQKDWCGQFLEILQLS